MTKLQDTVKRGQARWNRALLLGLSARGVGFGLLAGGCALLVGRAFGYRLDLPVAVIGLLGGLGWAAWQYRARKVSEKQVLTLLDLRTGGSGTLLHAFETGAEPAGGLDRALTRPRPAWRRSVVPALAPGLLFFALGLLMPVRATAQGAPELFAEARLAELEELAATLDETLELEEELQEEIEQNIETLRGSSEEPRPTGEAMREALDALEARLDEAAESAAAEMEEVVRQSSEASQGAADPDPEVREDAMDALGDLMEKGQEQGLMPKDQLSEELQQQLSELGLSKEAIEALAKLAEAGRMAELGKTAGELGLSPEQLAKLAEALAKGLNEAALKKLAEMAEKGLLNASGKMAKMPNAEELAEYLKKLQEQQSGGAEIGQGQGEGQLLGTATQPGSMPGVTRGPGTTPITWGNETPDLREQMTSEGLPAPDSPESAMQLLGFSQLAPEVKATAEGQQGGGAVGATGEAVWKRRMSPEHRKAVQRFFQRGEGDK